MFSCLALDLENILTGGSESGEFSINYVFSLMGSVVKKLDILDYSMVRILSWLENESPPWPA